MARQSSDSGCQIVDYTCRFRHWGLDVGSVVPLGIWIPGVLRWDRLSYTGSGWSVVYEFVLVVSTAVYA